MPEVFIGEAMVTALAELGAKTTVLEHCATCGELPEVCACPVFGLSAAPVQVPLFEPPPFDFEEAYDELHRLDLRAKNRKSAWESLKGAASDAKKDYDVAINDLHDKFDEIDSARRVAAAVRQGAKPAEPKTEGGEPQMSELEATIDPEETQGEEVPDEPKEPTDYDAGIGY